MGFERFGVVSHVTEGKVAQFVDYLEEGKVMATRCRRCGTTYFPPRADCSACLGDDMEWVELKGPGRLITYTTAHYGPTGFDQEVPYVLAVAEFPEGVRVFGRMSRGVAEQELRPGMEVKVVPVRLSEGRIAYELQPA